MTFLADHVTAAAAPFNSVGPLPSSS